MPNSPAYRQETRVSEGAGRVEWLTVSVVLEASGPTSKSDLADWSRFRLVFVF